MSVANQVAKLAPGEAASASTGQPETPIAAMVETRHIGVMQKALRFVAVVALVMNLMGSAQAAEREERVTAIGEFKVVRRVYAAEPTQPPSLHARTDWVEHVLRWRSKDGAITLTLVDDGINLAIRSSVGNCAGRAGPYQYGGDIGENTLFAAVDSYLAQAIRACIPERIKDRREFLRTRRSFGQAAEVLKARVLVEFKDALISCERPPQPPKVPALARCSVLAGPSV